MPDGDTDEDAVEIRRWGEPPALADPKEHTEIGTAPGITTLPHLRDLIIKGPYRPTGISETASRQKIFSCRPTGSAEEAPCARHLGRPLLPAGL